MPRKQNLFTRTADFFALIGAASAVAGATEARRAPRARDLEILGISKADFDNIGR